MKAQKSTTRTRLVLVFNVHLLSEDCTECVSLVYASMRQLPAKLENEKSLSNANNRFSIFVGLAVNYFTTKALHLDLTIESFELVLFKHIL